MRTIAKRIVGASSSKVAVLAMEFGYSPVEVEPPAACCNCCHCSYLTVNSQATTGDWSMVLAI